MPPPTSWSELADAAVGVWGIGIEGRATVRKLENLGARPTLVDDMPSADVLEGREVLATHRGGLDALLDCDVVVKSPGISRYRSEVAQLEQGGVPVCGGLGLWIEDVDRTRVVCITGTKGKSTTAALCVHLLKELGYQAEAGGNIGRPPWDPQVEVDDGTYWIIETSSFQVPDLTSGPPLVAVTSLSPDHLDWHGSVEAYYHDKLSLCTKRGVEVALVEGSDSRLRQHEGLLGPHVRWVDEAGAAGAFPPAATPHLRGGHNRRNVAVARAVLRALEVEGVGDEARLAAALRDFPGLPSRCRTLGHVDGVEFVDDSLSTNVLPAQAALAAFADRPVALLVGGKDRGLDYAALAQSVAERELPTLVVTIPDNGPHIGATIGRQAGSGVRIIDARDLDDAVAVAFEWATPGAVILLSPAAPSFGRFTDYRDRADAFAGAARRCGRLS